MSDKRTLSRQQIAIGIILVTLLIAAYFSTFDGYAISGDEWQLFDATESFARRGTLQLNYRFDEFQARTLNSAVPPTANTEPLQPALAAPLFLIAQALPDIGLAHTVWLFNIVITALISSTLYAFGLELGYRTETAALAALVFGLGTIVWPYSRTFFREPLFTWLALLSVFLIARLRHKLHLHRFPLRSAAALVAVLAATLLSKEASFLILPGILVEALPARLGRFRLSRRAMLIGGGMIAVTLIAGVVLINTVALSGFSNRYAFGTRLEQAQRNLSGASHGITGYLFSPARGIWWYSPVLLLGFLGWPRLIRERRTREIAVPVVMLASFVMGYSVVRGATEWYGGLGWGARYMVPVTPFLALWLLPVIDSLIIPGARLWKRAGLLLVFVFSAGIQIMASLVSPVRYYDTLAAQQPPVIPWTDGVWSLRWSPLRVTFTLLGKNTLDLAWEYATSPTWMLPGLCALLAAAAIFWLFVWMRRKPGRRTLALTSTSLLLASALVLLAGLYSLRQDSRYYGDFAPVQNLLKALDVQAQPADVILLNNREYAEFFMNYYKRARPVVYTLPRSPGERYSPEQAPELESPYPDALIQPGATIIVAALAQHHERAWLVINSSRFIPWSVRPFEQYLSRHYFPVSEIAPNDLARAILFDLTPAPPAPAAAWPEQPIAVTFGDSLQLIGCDLPAGTTRSPGDILPVSLLWEAIGPVEQDYSVGLFLVSPDGQLVAQRDSFPANGFDPTQAWTIDSLHRDNHGLALPTALAPGTYELWVAVYWWQAPADRLPVTRANGTLLGDHVVVSTIVVEP